MLPSPATGEVHRYNRYYIEVKVLMTTTGTTTATTMTQVSTPELEDEVVSVASPPLVVTEEDTTLSPAMELELERREFRVLDWVWEVDVPGLATVFTDPAAVTDPDTMLSSETAPKS